MTVKRDLYAKNTALLLQADGSAGALVDHSRAARVITPNDFASDNADKLYGVNSFTGKPTIAGFVFGTRGTIEAWVKIAASTEDQTLISNLDPASGRFTEWALGIRGSNNRQLDFYQGVRGSSELHAYPTFNADLPLGSWVHFFISWYPNQWYAGCNGVLTPLYATGFASDHIGHASNPVLVNGIALVPGGRPWLGKTHSIMLTDNLNRYGWKNSLAYTPPDDTFSNYYNDTGASNDPATGDNDYQVVQRVAQGGRPFRSSDKKIAGHVTYSGVNARKRVSLFSRNGSVLLQETYSRASDGYFEFNNLQANTEYFVVGFDDTPGSINAEVADHLVPA